MLATHAWGVQEYLRNPTPGLRGIDDFIDDTNLHGASDAARDHFVLSGKFELHLLTGVIWHFCQPAAMQDANGRD